MLLLAYIEVPDGTTEVEPASIIAVRTTKINPQTFAHEWNEGIQARQKWEQLCENFFQILIKSGIIDETGEHIDEYTPGSLSRYVIDNRDKIFSKEFLQSNTGMLVMATIKTASKTMKKGKVITADWKELLAHLAPMAEAILNQLLKSPARADMLQPLFDKYVKVESIQQATLNQ